MMYIQIVFASQHSIHLAHRERAVSGQWSQTVGDQKEADTTANPEFKGQLPQDIFSASVINLLLAEEEETAVWKQHAGQRSVHLKEAVTSIASEKSATAEIDN